MEQMKCGLTTPWLSHGTAPDNKHASETLEQSFNDQESNIDCGGKSAFLRSKASVTWILLGSAGHIFAYFQMHLGSFRIWSSVDGHPLFASPYIIPLLFIMVMCFSITVYTRGGSAHAYELKGPHVLNVLWPRKYLLVIHCWQTICRGRHSPIESKGGSLPHIVPVAYFDRAKKKKNRGTAVFKIQVSSFHAQLWLIW